MANLNDKLRLNMVVKDGVGKLRGEPVNMVNLRDLKEPRVVVNDGAKRKGKILISILLTNIVRML
tara:strand:+ start:187 stop:381 length:195 start_codon:yes stop_codon:yes gene_type:complete